MGLGFLQQTWTDLGLIWSNPKLSISVDFSCHYFPFLNFLFFPSTAVFVNTFVFLIQLMIPFTFCAVLFISPCCTWEGLYLYTTTLFVNDKLSLTNYFAGILLPCHYFISNNLLQLLAGKRRNKTCCMAMPWDPKYRNEEPTNTLSFLPRAYYLQSPLHLEKTCEDHWESINSWIFSPRDWDTPFQVPLFWVTLAKGTEE